VPENLFEKYDILLFETGREGLEVVRDCFIVCSRGGK